MSAVVPPYLGLLYNHIKDRMEIITNRLHKLKSRVDVDQLSYFIEDNMKLIHELQMYCLEQVSGVHLWYASFCNDLKQFYEFHVPLLERLEKQRALFPRNPCCDRIWQFWKANA